MDDDWSSPWADAHDDNNTKDQGATDHDHSQQQQQLDRKWTAFEDTSAWADATEWGERGEGRELAVAAPPGYEQWGAGSDWGASTGHGEDEETAAKEVDVRLESPPAPGVLDLGDIDPGINQREDEEEEEGAEIGVLKTPSPSVAAELHCETTGAMTNADADTDTDANTNFLPEHAGNLHAPSSSSSPAAIADESALENETLNSNKGSQSDFEGSGDNGGSGDGVDDDFEDFGDFAEEAEFDDCVAQSPPPPQPAESTPPLPLSPNPAIVPAFDIDTSLVSKFYPIPTSAPDLPPLEKEIISTIGARKAWYQLTQAGTLRKSDAPDDDHYVRVTWVGSKVQAEIHKIVSKWGNENRTPGNGGPKGPRSLGAMFGWGAATTTTAPDDQDNQIDKKLPFGISNVNMVSQSHSRHSSESGLCTVIQSKNASARPSIDKSATSSPQTPSFGWPSSSNQTSPLKSVFDATALQPAQLSAPASRRVSLVLGRGSIQNSPTVSSFQHSPIASSFTLSEKSAGSEAIEMTLNDLESLTKTSKNAKPQSSPAFGEWEAFDSLNKQSASNSNNIQAPDDWRTFETPVSTGTPPSTRPTSFHEDANIPDPMESNGVDDWAEFETFKPKSDPTQPLGLAMPSVLPTSDLNGANGLGPDGTRKEEAAEISNLGLVSPEPEVIATHHTPLDLSILPLTIYDNHDQTQSNIGDNDDEWGGMQSPTNSTPIPLTAVLTLVPLAEHSTPFSTNAIPASNLFGETNGLSRSNTLPSQVRPTPGIRNPSSALSTHNKSIDSVFNFPAMSPPTIPNPDVQNDGDNWDFSFFEQPSPAVNQLPPLSQESCSSDLWDAPAPAVPPKNADSEEDAIIKEIVGSLPNLSYLLV